MSDNQISPAATSGVTFATPEATTAFFERESPPQHFSQRASTLDELRDVKQNMIQLFMATVDIAKGMTQNDEGKWVYTPDSDEDLAKMPQNLAVILDEVDGPMRKMTSSLGDKGKLGIALLSYDALNEEKAGHTKTCDAIDDVLQSNDYEIRDLKATLFAMKEEKYAMEVDKVNIGIAHQEIVRQLMTTVKGLQRDNARLTDVQSQSALARDYADASAAAMDAEDAKFAAGLDAEDAKNAVVATTTKAANNDKYAAFAGLFESMVDQANEDKDSAGPGHHVIEQTVTTRKVRITRDPESGVTTKVTDMDAGVLHGEKIGDTDSLTFVTRFGEGQAPERDERAYHACKHVGTENLANTFLSGKVRKEITMNSFD